MAYILLCIIIAISLYNIKTDKVDYAHLKAHPTSKNRIALYRSWIKKSYITIGLPGALVLLILQKTYYLSHPIWANETTALFRRGFSAQVLPGMLGGVAAGGIVGLGLMSIATVMKTRWAGVEKTSTIGDVQALLPKNAKERRYGLPIAIGAGLNEELLFRVTVPVLLLQITHNPSLAVVLSVLGFGVMHTYQGIGGVLGATFAGGMLMGVYLLTGSIIPGMLFHTYIDTNAFVIQPWVASIAGRSIRKNTRVKSR
jgi:membrane protease YdiL (CAAX protease family)